MRVLIVLLTMMSPSFGLAAEKPYCNEHGCGNDEPVIQSPKTKSHPKPARTTPAAPSSKGRYISTPEIVKRLGPGWGSVWMTPAFFSDHGLNLFPVGSASDGDPEIKALTILAEIRKERGLDSISDLLVYDLGDAERTKGHELRAVQMIYSTRARDFLGRSCEDTVSSMVLIFDFEEWIKGALKESEFKKNRDQWKSVKRVGCK